MHTEKFKVSQLFGILGEADRSIYKKDGKVKDCVSKSNINPEKSDLNYSLCAHAQYTPKEVKAIYERITGKSIRKDATFTGTIVTLPEELKKAPMGEIERFFEVTYKTLKEIYKIDEKDVIQAQVHLDETTPHLHFYFIPHYRDGEKEGINHNKSCPRTVYQKQHKMLQAALDEAGIHCCIENGKTQGIEVKAINKAQRKEYAQLKQQIEEQKTEIEALKQEEITRTILLEDLKKDNEKVNDELTNTQKELSDAQIRLTTAQNEIKQIEEQKTLLEALKNQIEDLWSRFYRWTQQIIPKIELDIQKEQNPQRKEGRKSFVIKSRTKIKTLGDAVMNKNLGKAQQIADRLDADYLDYQDEFER